MIIEENGNYLAHYKHKGSKNGIRRHQSYAVAPTRSGMVGQEIGEAARQRERVESEKARKKALLRGDIEAANKKRWAKKYKSLYRHSDKYTNQELEDALYRLDLREKIHRRSLDSLENASNRGQNTLRNMAGGLAGAASIYNAIALGSNAYNAYTRGKYPNMPNDYTNLPTIDTSRIGLGNSNNKKKKSHK